MASPLAFRMRLQQFELGAPERLGFGKATAYF